MANNDNERPPRPQRPVPGMRGDGGGDGPNNPLAETTNQQNIPGRHGGGDSVLRPRGDRPGNNPVNPPNSPNN